MKVSPVRLQFKSFSRKADVNAYLDKLRRDAANEPDAAVRKRHMSYIRFVKRLGSRDAVSRRFFVIFQYEAPTNERNISYAEIVSTLETTARNFRTYLAQCGNAIVEHENEDEFITDVFYAEIDNITRFERGSALIVTNSNNVTVDMRCSEEEKDLITTDRDELRRIVERKMQNQTETEES